MTAVRAALHDRSPINILSNKLSAVMLRPYNILINKLSIVLTNKSLAGKITNGRSVNLNCPNISIPGSELTDRSEFLPEAHRPEHKPVK